jgi:hypothetical protein
MKRVSLYAMSFVLVIGALAVAEDKKDIFLTTRVDPVEVEFFIPKEARPVKGILVHVFNHRLKASGRWAALCREQQWAHINTIISRSANNRPAKIREAINESLQQFAKETGLPELVHVPRTGTGFSAGGMAIQVLETDPDRMLTNAISCSWVRDPEKMGQAAAIPELFVIGSEPDGFKMLPAIEEFYEPAIEQQLPWGLGLQHGCKHDWANSGTLFVPWIQAIAKMRYPKDVDVSKPIPLRPVSFAEGWRGDRTTINGTYASVAAANEFKGDTKMATWLPNRATAYVWRAWQTKKSPVDLAASTADGKKLPPFQPKKSLGMSIAPGVELTLAVNVMTELEIETVKYFDGDKLIGQSNEAPFEVKWSSPKIGCYTMWAEYFVDGKPGATNPALLVVEPME